jgi:hypothetical protein
METSKEIGTDYQKVAKIRVVFEKENIYIKSWRYY